jgi:hypothetical protein
MVQRVERGRISALGRLTAAPHADQSAAKGGSGPLMASAGGDISSPGSAVGWAGDVQTLTLVSRVCSRGRQLPQQDGIP